MKRSATGHPRILLMRGGAIGDFVLTLPALQLLRERWPQSYIELVGYPHIAALALEAGMADAVSSMHRADVARLFVPRAALPEEQRRAIRSFDLVITYFYDPDDIVRRNLLAAGAHQVIYADPIVRGRHAIDHLVQPLEDLALYPEAEPAPLLTLRAGTLREGQCRVAAVGAQVVVLHPGSGSPRKNWPLERFADLAQGIAAAGRQPLFLLGEAEGDCGDRLDALAPGLPRLQGLDLVDVAAVLRAASAYVGNDSGITHMAAAVGTPVVALFGASDPALWGPRGSHVTILQPAGAGSEGPAGVDVDRVRGAVADCSSSSTCGPIRRPRRRI